MENNKFNSHQKIILGNICVLVYVYPSVADTIHYEI